jgi:hypothetical protein
MALTHCVCLLSQYATEPASALRQRRRLELEAAWTTGGSSHHTSAAMNSNAATSAAAATATVPVGADTDQQLTDGSDTPLLSQSPVLPSVAAAVVQPLSTVQAPTTSDTASITAGTGTTTAGQQQLQAETVPPRSLAAAASDSSLEEEPTYAAVVVGHVKGVPLVGAGERRGRALVRRANRRSSEGDAVTVAASRAAALAVRAALARTTAGAATAGGAAAGAAIAAAADSVQSPHSPHARSATTGDTPRGHLPSPALLSVAEGGSDSGLSSGVSVSPPRIMRLGMDSAAAVAAVTVADPPAGVGAAAAAAAASAGALATLQLPPQPQLQPLRSRDRDSNRSVAFQLDTDDSAARSGRNSSHSAMADSSSNAAAADLASGTAGSRRSLPNGSKLLQQLGARRPSFMRATSVSAAAGAAELLPSPLALDSSNSASSAEREPLLLRLARPAHAGGSGYASSSSGGSRARRASVDCSSYSGGGGMRSSSSTSGGAAAGSDYAGGHLASSGEREGDGWCDLRMVLRGLGEGGGERGTVAREWMCACLRVSLVFASVTAAAAVAVAAVALSCSICYT